MFREIPQVFPLFQVYGHTVSEYSQPYWQRPSAATGTEQITSDDVTVYPDECRDIEYSSTVIHT